MSTPISGTTERRSVAVVVLTWNALTYTKECFDALFAVTDHPSWRLIVVDNGSVDGTKEYLRGRTDLTLIENADNLGYTKAVNQGIAAAGPHEDVLLLNNDITHSDPGWLSKLQDAAYEADDIGIVGCRLLQTDGRINHTGAYMPPITMRGYQTGGLEKDINQAVDRHEVESVIFACAYLTRACLDAVGPLDEGLFAYFDDSDFGLTAAQKGFRTIYAGDVTALHHHNTSTRENKVDFGSIYNVSRKYFVQKWSKWLEHDRYDLDVAVHSVIHQPLGYAVTAREIMRGLHFQGARVTYRNAYGNHDARDHEALFADIQRRELDSDAIQLAYSQGDAFTRVKGNGPKVGWTMLEVTGLPKPWVEGCNAMDEVWVPASFNVDTFKASGVTTPIRVMPLGIDPSYFHPGITASRVSDRFTFLSVFEWGERKAPEVLLRSFAEEFSPHDNVVLLLSVFNRDPSINVEDEIAKLDLPPTAPIVVMENAEFAGYQMGALYRSADCFVLPTRGEGWGMPVLEAMACGLPTISTDWGAVTDFLDETVGYPLRSKPLVDADARCVHYDGFAWADPDPDHLRFLMRHVSKNPEEAALKGAAASARAHSEFSWRRSVTRAKARLMELR